VLSGRDLFAGHHLPERNGERMAPQNNNDMPGKIIFAITLVATLAFFWWLLVYDHGVVSAH